MNNHEPNIELKNWNKLAVPSLNNAETKQRQ